LSKLLLFLWLQHAVSPPPLQWHNRGSSSCPSNTQ
jgi:hypothetical protein